MGEGLARLRSDAFQQDTRFTPRIYNINKTKTVNANFCRIVGI